MRESWFGRRSVGCVSSVTLAALCAALAFTSAASAADLFTEPAPPPQAYQYPPPPPPAYGPAPYVQGYVQQGYVQQGYVTAPAPYYRPYAPAYRSYGWAEPGYAYSPGYVEAVPRPPAPVVAPAYQPWGPYPHYESDAAAVAPPAYGYPPRW
jgi:hypothetical protein